MKEACKNTSNDSEEKTLVLKKWFKLATTAEEMKEALKELYVEVYLNLEKYYSSLFKTDGHRRIVWKIVEKKTSLNGKFFAYILCCNNEPHDRIARIFGPWEFDYYGDNQVNVINLTTGKEWRTKMVTYFYRRSRIEKDSIESIENVFDVGEVIYKTVDGKKHTLLPSESNNRVFDTTFSEFIKEFFK